MIFYIQFYPIISFMLCLIYLFKAIKIDPPLDPITNMKRLNEYLEEISERSPAVANFFCFLIESTMNGDKMYLYLFFYFLFLIPVFRLILFISIFTYDIDEEE